MRQMIAHADEVHAELVHWKNEACKFEQVRILSPPARHLFTAARLAAAPRLGHCDVSQHSSDMEVLSKLKQTQLDLVEYPTVDGKSSNSPPLDSSEVVIASELVTSEDGTTTVKADPV